jgi:ElaB/YqjD/DUF883 family membrane-anchored ribosome-binding protein
MDAVETKAGRTGNADAHDQIRELREQVEALMRERVTPILSEAAGRAQDAARHVGDLAHDQTEAVAKRVQERPLTSILIAAAAGYIVGRITR